MNKKDFYLAVEARRSIYSISNEKVINDEELIEVINYAVKHTPSAFNSQRAIILLENNRKFWDIKKETLRKIVPANSFESTEGKLNAFAGGYGTILFFM